MLDLYYASIIENRVLSCKLRVWRLICSEIKGNIDALKAQNESYFTLTDLHDAKKMVDEILKTSMGAILRDIEQEIYDRMEEFNSSLFSESRRLHV